MVTVYIHGSEGKLSVCYLVSHLPEGASADGFKDVEVVDGGRAEAGAGVGAGLVLAPAGGLVLLTLGLVHPGVTGYHVLSLSCIYMASSS